MHAIEGSARSWKRAGIGRCDSWTRPILERVRASRLRAELGDALARPRDAEGRSGASDSRRAPAEARQAATQRLCGCCCRALAHGTPRILDDGSRGRLIGKEFASLPRAHVGAFSMEWMDGAKARAACARAQRGADRALEAGGVARYQKKASRLVHLVFVDESAFLLIDRAANLGACGCTPLLHHYQRRERISVISGLSVSPKRRRLVLLPSAPKNIQHPEVCEFLRHLLRHLRGPSC